MSGLSHDNCTTWQTISSSTALRGPTAVMNRRMRSCRCLGDGLAIQGVNVKNPAPRGSEPELLSFKGWGASHSAGQNARSLFSAMARHALIVG